MLPKTVCELNPPKWRASLSWSAVSTTLVFDGRFVPLDEQLATVRVGRQASEKWFVSGGFGALVDGTLAQRGGTLALRPAFALDASGTYVWRDGTKGPFVTSTFSASVLRAFLERDDAYLAIDFRASGVVGTTVFSRAAVYAGASLFGGPVWVRSPAITSVGGDRWHFRVLGGALVALFAHVDAFVEVAPLGEQAISAGIGSGF